MTSTLKGLGSRAIIGAFNKRLEEISEASWVSRIASKFDSNQESENYNFLSDAPAMEEWVAHRTKTGLRRFDFTITNKKFSAMLEIDEDDWRRDKTSQILTRVNDLAARAAQLPQKILTKVLNDNAVAYDGVQLYHATDHKTLKGTVVNNVVTQTAATGTMPTVAEAVDGLLTAVSRLLSFVDDAGEPRNEFAKSFVCMCGPTLFPVMLAAMTNTFVSNGVSNSLMALGFQWQCILNARISNAAQCYLFRADSDVRALVWQDEVPTIMQALTEGSDYHTLNDSRLYPVKRVCNGGVGRYDQTVRLEFT